MNYYNEFDPKAAAWLRELIKQGHIPNGVVDERSITEIKPNELTQYTQCHFFAGIGGWSLALELAGWPADRPVWTGSCPCQPFSIAGTQLGDKDERHLWPTFFNLVRECRPDTVFGEQVANAIGKGWLDGVSSDLEGAGYACGAAVLGAHSVGSPHIRQRLFWLANATGGQREQRLRSQGDDVQRSADDGATGWKRVVHADECIYEEWDEDREQPVCPVCAGEYGGWGAGVECGCPGPTEEGYEFDERDGVLYGRRLANALDTGSQGGLPRREDAERSNLDRHAGCGGTDSWSNYDVIPCADGKARRIEPGLAPLANGVSGRVGLLRGYRNAIVPPLAAQFIYACEKAKDDLELL